MPRELLGALERVVRVAHRAGGDYARLRFAPQVVANDAQRVLLGADGVEIVVAIAFRAAVAVDAAVGAAAVDIHIVARAEPARAVWGAGDDGLCRYGLHGRTAFPEDSATIIPEKAGNACPDML